MFLKRLEVFGFKSFADKTVIDFTGGVTALVGPNGCGKSNVVDSIRWALGEQSARSLRGSEMVDLIFNGTTNRRPLGFAEVVLTFDNSKRPLPVDAAEVSVTRRLYRTGECEYLINGQACRLRDVRDLFMDTGVGVGAYSIIEQGKIDALLQSSPKERRGIFEEAAGIAKYRSRKAAALRKLERVEQNLLRVGDVTAEIERQLRSVQRQAAKARRYRELAEELKSLRLTVLAADYRAMAAKREELGADLASAEDLVSGLSAESGRLEASIAEAQTRADELERASSEAERKRSEDRARLARVEAAIASAENLARQHEETAERAAREADELIARAAAAEADEKRAREEHAGAVAELESLSGRLGEAETAASGGAARAAELAAAIEKRKSEAIEVVRRRAGVDSQVSKLLSQIEHFDAEISRGEQRVGALTEKLAAARTEVEHGTARVEELGRRRAAVAENIKAERATEAAMAAEVSELDARASRLASELSAKRSRLHILSDLEARQEGIQAGVRGVLSAMREGSAPAGLCGMVADLVKVREQFEVAIETALGSKVQNVVAEDTNAARGAVELLKHRQLGRATFLPLDRVRAGWQPSAESLAEPGVLGRGADLVEFEERLRPAFEHLLGNVVVVQDLDVAVRVANNGCRSGVVVTIEGEIFYPSGAITGGAYRNRFPGIISRKNEIARLNEEIAAGDAELGGCRARRGEAEGQRVRAKARAEELGSEHSALSAGEIQMRQGLEMVAREASRLAEEEVLVNRELVDRRERRAAIQTGLDGLRAEGQLLHGEEESIGRAIAEMSETLEKAEAERAELREALTRLRIETAALEEKRSSLAARAEAAARLLAERRAEAESRREAARTADHAAGEERRKAEGLRAELDEAVKAAAAAEQAGTDLAVQRSEMRSAIETAQAAERECRAKLASANSRVGEIKLAERELALRLESLLERAKAEGQENLPEFAQTVDPEAVNMEDLRSQLEEGEDKLRKMGEVNLSAIGEEDALRVRLSDLAVQKTDLEEAGKLLKDAIARINKISRERFTATFELVRENFHETYRKLFGGGRADIMLEEGQDVLEAGIEVVAKPPGKDMMVMSLLSGGERTLTTIALLFAIFKAKPSPFCVLDEVDAPLDESNIDRFMLILREFLESSQFLIITHNRRTMATADVIYGVTMQEAGVSKRIAVKFEEVGEELAVA